MTLKQPQHQSSLSSHESPENGFSRARKNEIIRGLVNGMSAWEWLYEWERKDSPEHSWMGLYLQTKNTPAYQRFSHEEHALFSTMQTSLQKLFFDKKIDNCVHLGTGDGQTWIDYIASLPGAQEHLPDKKYIPVDINPWAANHAGKKIGWQCHMKVDPLIADWLKTDHLRSVSNKAILFEWASLGNFSPADVRKLLRQLGTERGRGTRLVASFFVAPEREDPEYQTKIDAILQGYQTPEVEQWIMQWLAEVGIDCDALDFCVEFQSPNDWHDLASVRVWARVKPGRELRIEVDGQTRILPAWFPLWAIASRRFTLQQIKQIFTDQDWKVDAVVSGEFVWVITAKSKSGFQQYVWHHQQKIKTAAITALLASSAWWAKQRWDSHTMQKNIEQKIAYNIQFKNTYKHLDRRTTEYKTPQEKLVRVYELAKHMVSLLKVRYHGFAFPDDQELQNALALTLSQHNNLAQFADGDEEQATMVEFIDHVFWPNYTSSTTALEHTVLYEYLQPNEPLLHEAIDRATKTEISEAQTITTWFKGFITMQKTWKVEVIGQYVTTRGEWFELAKASKVTASLSGHPSFDGEQLVARRVRGDTEPFGKWSTADAKIIATDYFKKWYVDQLVLALLPLVQENWRVLSAWELDKKTAWLHHHDFLEVIESTLITLNRQWYDFSYLLEPDAKDMHHRFLYSFLAEYQGLSDEQQCVFEQYGIKSSHQKESKELSLSSAIDALTNYLDTYFYAVWSKQSLFLLKKELTREMLQNPDLESKYTRLVDEEACFAYLYARKELCAQFGYKINAWEDFSDREPGFRKLLAWTAIKIDRVVPVPGAVNYFNNFYRTADGRVFSIAGNRHEMGALEITPETNHHAIEQLLPHIKKEIEAKRWKGFWSLKWSGRDELAKNDVAMRYVNETYLPFTMPAAQVVAQDYFEQKYATQLAQEMTKQLMTHCRPPNIPSLSDDVEKVIAQTIVSLMVSYVLTPAEINAAKTDPQYCQTLFHYFIIPEGKAALEDCLHMDIGAELPYAAVDQLPFIPIAIQEFMQSFGVCKDWMVQSARLTAPKTQSIGKLSHEQQQVAQTLVKTLATVKPEDYDLSTHLGRYKFFMEQRAEFASLGYTYHSRYFSYLGKNIINNTRTLEKEQVMEDLWSGMMKQVVREVVTPVGRYQMTYTMNALWRDFIFARPVFTEEEMRSAREALRGEFARRYGVGYISGAESQRVEDQFAERYVRWRTSHAKQLFDELYAVYGEHLYDRDPTFWDEYWLSH